MPSKSICKLDMNRQKIDFKAALMNDNELLGQNWYVEQKVGHLQSNFYLDCEENQPSFSIMSLSALTSTTFSTISGVWFGTIRTENLPITLRGITVFAPGSLNAP